MQLLLKILISLIEPSVTSKFTNLIRFPLTLILLLLITKPFIFAYESFPMQLKSLELVSLKVQLLIFIF